MRAAAGGWVWVGQFTPNSGLTGGALAGRRGCAVGVWDSVADFVGHGGDGEQCGRATWGQGAAWGAVGDGAVETALHEMLQVGILCCSRAFEFVS